MRQYFNNRVSTVTFSRETISPFLSTAFQFHSLLSLSFVHPISLIRLSHLSTSSSFLFKRSRPAKWSAVIVLVPFSQLEAASVPSFDVPFTRVNEREEGRISHEKEIVRKAKGGAALEERRDNRDDESAGGRRKEKEYTVREVKRRRSSLSIVC